MGQRLWTFLQLLMQFAKMLPRRATHPSTLPPTEDEARGFSGALPAPETDVFTEGREKVPLKSVISSVLLIRIPDPLGVGGAGNDQPTVSPETFPFLKLLGSCYCTQPPGRTCWVVNTGAQSREGHSEENRVDNGGCSAHRHQISCPTEGC